VVRHAVPGKITGTANAAPTVPDATPVMYRVKLTMEIFHYSLPMETMYLDKSKITFCHNGKHSTILLYIFIH